MEKIDRFCVSFEAHRTYRFENVECFLSFDDPVSALHFAMSLPVQWKIVDLKSRKTYSSISAFEDFIYENIEDFV